MCSIGWRHRPRRESGEIARQRLACVPAPPSAAAPLRSSHGLCKERRRSQLHIRWRSARAGSVGGGWRVVAAAHHSNTRYRGRGPTPSRRSSLYTHRRSAAAARRRRAAAAAGRRRRQQRRHGQQQRRPQQRRLACELHSPSTQPSTRPTPNLLWILLCDPQADPALTLYGTLVFYIGRTLTKIDTSLYYTILVDLKSTVYIKSCGGHPTGHPDKGRPGHP